MECGERLGKTYATADSAYVSPFWKLKTRNAIQAVDMEF
jgi:hypothetical protein